MTRILLPSRINTPRWPVIYDRDQTFDRRKFQYVSNGVEVCSLFKQWQDDHGWQRRYFLALRHLNDHDVLFFPVLAQQFVTSPTGSNQTLKSDQTWNNANNSVECVGASGGGASQTSGSSTTGGGGSAGAYASVSNYNFASPGFTTVTVNVGSAGTGGPTTGNGVAGTAGTATWFNGANLAASTVGADLGGAGQPNGAGSGSGGQIANCKGTVKSSGGTGAIGGASAAGGGGGAGGPHGNGSDASGANGGNADNNTVSAPSGGASTAIAGNSGTEFITAGVGTGAAGCASGSVDAPGKAGGLYGGAGCGGYAAVSMAAGGNGTQGIIVLTWSAIVFTVIQGIGGAQGTNVVDFGTSGSNDAFVTITGQSNIKSNSLVQAWIIASPTKDNSTAEHYNNAPIVMAGDIVPGVGFTIRAFSRDFDLLSFGQWTVGWCWN